MSASASAASSSTETTGDLLAELAGEIIPLLRRAQEGNLRPPAAQELLRPLRLRRPDLEIELLWQEEPFDHSFHFDVLVRDGSGDTLSVALCADRELPWPLRGAHRWSEFALVSINGRVINANEAFGWLDFLFEDQRAIRHIVDTRLVQDELDLRPVEVSDEEVQVALDRLRRSRRLFTAEETTRWLDQQGLEVEDLEHWARRAASHEALRRRVAASRDGVEAYFARTRDGWDRLLTLRLVAASPDAAAAMQAALAAGVDPQAAATALVAEGRGTALELVWRRRRSSPGGELGQVRAAPVDGRVVVEVVLKVVAAELDAATREEVLAAMFADWLADQRAQAHIEWYWGRAKLLEGRIVKTAAER